MYQLSDYQFELPDGLIAETAAQPAHSAKMMILSKTTGNTLAETTFWELDTYLDEKNVLFFNNSRVIRARIPLHNNTFYKDNGEEGHIGEWEIFFLKNMSENTFEALVRPGKKFQVGHVFPLWKYNLKVIAHSETGRVFEIQWGDIYACLEEFGNLPLPPYIEYREEKEKDYQSVFAQKNGSVASPTASLHFSEELVAKLKNEKNFVTLHIGLGTFKTIDTDDIRQYEIHSERCEVSTEIFNAIFRIKEEKRLITAVGTTACRTLESLPSLWKHLDNSLKQTFAREVRGYWNSLSESANGDWIDNTVLRGEENGEVIEFSTRAYITPGYTFLVIDELITNFHLPESSLLVLVSTLIWQKNLMKRYEEAIASEYRFFSFGDGMYIKNI